MLNDLINNRIDLGGFDKNYKNDETGERAIAPEVLMKLVLYGYTKGRKSSRSIYELGRNTIIAKELTDGMEPHWRTIGDFISKKVKYTRKYV